ncbi:hypothetical protein ID866_3647 [Astraeus odoratus]|nr:hypothetical protein ID866_3647 [Astraeus odoratus]
MAERMFEPSDTWRYTPVDRSARYEASGSTLTPDSLVRHPSPSSYTCHQPPSNPLGEHSQRNVPSLPPRSPTVGEPPRKKFKSRSSSPSSTASGRVQSAISEAKNKPFVDHLPAQFDGAATQLATPRSTSQDQDIPQEDSAASAQGMYIGSSTCQLTSHETTHVTNELSDRNINLDLHLPSPVTTVPASDDYTVPTQASPERVDGSPMGSELPKEIPREPLSSSNAAGATSLATPERTSEPPLPSHNTAEEGELLSSAAHPSPVCQLPNANAHSTTAISGLKVGVGITSSAQRAISSPQIVPSEEPISMRDGLRLVVLSRLRRDRQTRDERVFPLLRANQVVSDLQCVPGSSDSQSRLFKDTMGDGRVNERTAEHDQIRSAFVDHFFKRQSKIAAKAERLKEEYLALHERWLEHCARLDEEQKSGITEEVAVPSGRATRRSTAILGDAVRSDLEMEQIIASLGVEELTDPNYLAIKNVAKIPDMISVTHGCVSYVFDDTNNVIDNPAEFYGACSGSDYWTEEERDIFLREFAAHPKQFGVIAEQLPNKTAAQCVTYYYLQKKQGVDFRKAVAQYGVGRRRRNGRSAKQRGNALLTDIRRHDDEVSRVSSAAALNGPTSGKRRRAANVQNGEQRRTNPLRRVAAQPEVSASSATTPDPEVEPPRRRRRPAASRLLISSVADSIENDTVVSWFTRTFIEYADDACDAQGKEVEGRTSKRGRKSRTATSETLMTPSEEAITPVVDPSPSEDPEDAAVQRTPLAPNTWSEDDKSADPPLSAC